MDNAAHLTGICVPGKVACGISLVGSIVSQTNCLREEIIPLAANRGWTVGVYAVHGDDTREVLGTTVAWN